MEMIYSTEIRGWTVAATTAKIELNGARREVEAQVEINFFSFLLLFSDIFFLFLPHKNRHTTKFQLKQI